MAARLIADLKTCELRERSVAFHTNQDDDTAYIRNNVGKSRSTKVQVVDSVTSFEPSLTYNWASGGVP